MNMDIESIVSTIMNNGVAVALLAYFVYRDNKFMNSLDVTLKTLQVSVDDLSHLIKEEHECHKEEWKK